MINVRCYDLPRPPLSTTARPGSHEKVAVMRSRAEEGYSLWNARDNRGDEDRPEDARDAARARLGRGKYPRRPDLAGADTMAVVLEAMLLGVTAHGLSKRLGCSDKYANTLLCRLRSDQSAGVISR
jgi:hypothetical protein